MSNYKPTRITLTAHVAKQLADQGRAMGAEIRERNRRRAASALLDDRDETIRSLRAEVEALRDKARRFKGWRVRIDDVEARYLLVQQSGMPREVDYKPPLVGLREARVARRRWMIYENGTRATVVRVYRRARPA